MIADLLSTQPLPTRSTIILLSFSASASSKILVAEPHGEQETFIKFLKTIELILQTQPALDFWLGWLLKTAPFVGRKRVRQLAFEAIRTVMPNSADELHTIKFQQQSTKAVAVTAWAKHWDQSPRTSLAYQTALTGPPDGRPYPTFLTPLAI